MRLISNCKNRLFFGKYQPLKTAYFHQFRIINWQYRLVRICLFVGLLICCEPSFSQAFSKEKSEQTYFGPDSMGIVKFALQPEFSQDEQLDLSLYDLQGKLEKSTKLKVTEGMDSIVWNTLEDGIKVPTGVYIFKITGSAHQFEKRIVLDCGCRE